MFDSLYEYVICNYLTCISLRAENFRCHLRLKQVLKKCPCSFLRKKCCDTYHHLVYTNHIKKRWMENEFIIKSRRPTRAQMMKDTDCKYMKQISLDLDDGLFFYGLFCGEKEDEQRLFNA